MFLLRGAKLNVDSETILKKLFEDGSLIEIIKKRNIINDSPGKPLKVIIEDYNDEIICKWEVGTLEQIKDFYSKLKLEIYTYKTSIGNHLIEDPVIYPGKIELKMDDERTFSAIGIRENFICKVKFSENN